MKFLKNRVLPVVCALSILAFAVVVPVSADWVTSRDVRDDDSVEHWEAKLVPISNLELYIKFASNFGELSGTATVKDVFWNLVNRVVLGHEVGEVGIDDLEILCAQYNNYFNRELAESFGEQILSGTHELMNDILATVFFGKPSLTFEVRSWDTSGMQRIYCPELDAWVVSSNGRYAYANEAYLDTSGGNQWIGEVTAGDRAESGVVNMQDLDRLNLMCVKLKEDGKAVQLKTLNGDDGKSKYYGIWYNRQFYADENGNPFVAPYNTNEWASNQSRPDTSVKDENGEEVEDLPEDNTTNIDLSGMTITLPDGSINLIDKIIYDESTKTYHIDSHDTYNYTTNNYYTWNYYINYTSITYIGQTEEYNKYYEVYYELPDGRDSADLTAEEVEQLNVSVDVIPYGRSADDTSLRSLYHFDGDTRDSSYWNYCTDFTWNKGASLTYMDAGVFDGALYLDETEHEFTLTLPSNITSGDFTLQFRYYQSYTAAPQTDSYIELGGTTVFQFNGSQFLNASGTALASTPVGSWNEIALIRDGGTLYYYLNGVKIGSVSNSTAFDNTVTFHFGSSQQTYKYFDELRFLNYALQTGGANYECTSVPYDTNLSLVLPGSSVPVADEYWSINSSYENLIDGNFCSGVLPSSFDTQSSCLQNVHFPEIGIVSTYSSIECYPNYSRLTRINNTTVSSREWVGGLGFLVWKVSNSSYTPTTYLNPGTYTLSVVLSDGTVCSYTDTFTTRATYFDRYKQFDWGRIGMVQQKHSTNSGACSCFYYILPNESSYVDIAYVEFVAGSTTDLTAEWVTSVTEMTTDQLNTPTLAVRTDLDITSYQIGGVRPSLPTKGQVWALVENERITSIQIYNGQAWEACDGRIWTGERWIPASSYNIITLQDMYDIVDATQDYEYIYTESGFWSWWQKSWNAFTEKLFSLLGVSSGTSGGSGATGGSGSSELGNVDLDAEDEISDPESEDGKTLWQFIVLVIAGGKSVVSGTRKLFSGVVSSVPESMDTLTSAFDTGGYASGMLDGTGTDPDAVDYSETEAASLENEESEVSDPWRYR